MIETEYRKIKALNQSSLVLFDEDPIQFYKENILGEPRKSKPTNASLIGDMADFYLLECKASNIEFDQRFDERYVRFEGTKSTAQVFYLTDELFEIAKRNSTDGIVTGDFQQMFKQAFQNARSAGKYSDKDEAKAFAKALTEFAKDGKAYYDTKLKSVGRDVVDDIVVDIAKRVSEQILTDSNVSWIFRGNSDIEYLPKFPVEFSYKGFDCKMEADMIHIDHEDKIIQPFDLKVTYDNELFEHSYLKRSYYIQGGFYRLGIRDWAIKEKLDYEVKPMKFIVGDSSFNARRPLVYETNEDLFQEAIKGFSILDRKYRGVDDLMDEISWAQENAIWNISRENYENKSIIKMNSYGKYNK